MPGFVYAWLCICLVYIMVLPHVTDARFRDKKGNICVTRSFSKGALLQCDLPMRGGGIFIELQPGPFFYFYMTSILTFKNVL